MIPDYTPPEGWRLVSYRDLPDDTEYIYHSHCESMTKLDNVGHGPARPVLVRVGPPFDFMPWANAIAHLYDGKWVCRWDRIEPVAEHVELRDPFTGRWFPPRVSKHESNRTIADVVFEVREKT
jgi:hypothetical protein